MAETNLGAHLNTTVKSKKSAQILSAGQTQGLQAHVHRLQCMGR